MKKTNYGFTLIELLVVIVIIGILAGIGISTFKQYQGKARDARRLTEITTIKKALDLYYIENEDYPSGDANTTHNCSINTVNWDAFLSKLGSATFKVERDGSWPYCMFYIKGGYPHCDGKTNPAYTLIFTTEQTLYPIFDEYNLVESNAKARYCLYDN